MESIIRANIGHYTKLLENEEDPQKSHVLLNLLADENIKLEELTQRAATKKHLSEIPLNGCHVQSVRQSILKLRRGPIFHSKGKMIFCEGEPARYLMVVLDGAIRLSKLFEDGTRGIAQFYLPGDIIGLSNERLYNLSAEAASDAVVLYIKRSELFVLAAEEKSVAEFVFAAMSLELLRLQHRVVMVGKEAIDRVADFLFDLWSRLGSPRCVHIPMDYQDVANHLGLTNETLSRALAVLESRKVIRRGSLRRITVRSRITMGQAS